MSSDDDALRLSNALKAWRDSLLMLGGRNRLLNYKPTRSSTLEFVRATADEVVASLDPRKGVPVIGLKPPKPIAAIGEEPGGELEEAALDIIEEINVGDYPNHLFVEKTQREAERGLRNLARAASREYLDRGLSVLYLALGGLRWEEENGDPRFSPLLFLPVNLRADGPKQPHRLYPSDEDVVANPALAIRLREQGIALPDQAEIDQLFAEGGVEAVEARVRSLALPERWSVEPLCVLSTFMFSKEAMYRDLEANEDRILGSPLIQSLVGAKVDGVVGALTFDPTDPNRIDEVSPPETAPLILDADATQRVAISAAVEGRSFVMDGPPGTGKSQTIANMIAALTAEGKRVLFVSEKAVALDVVRDRLTARGLGSLLFELHSHKATRAEVAKSLGAALANRPVLNDRPDPVPARVRPMRETLTAYAEAMSERRRPIGWTLFEALGLAADLPSSEGLPRVATPVDWLTQERWERIRDLEAPLSRLWADLLLKDAHPWRGLSEAEGLTYDIGAATQSLEALSHLLDEVAPDRALVRLESLSRWRDVAKLAEVWDEGAHSWRSRSWLVDASSAHLRTDVPALVARARDVLGQAASLQAVLGDGWRELRSRAGIRLVPEDLSRAIGITPGVMTIDALEDVLDPLQAVKSALQNLERSAATLADLLGMSRPSAIQEAEELAAAVRIVVAPVRLEAAWLSDGADASMSQALIRLREAQVAEAAAAAKAREHFRDSIVDVDIEAIVARWDATPSWRKTLIGPHGEDRQALEPHLLGKPKEAFRVIRDATQWQRARADLRGAEHEVEALFHFVPKDESSFIRAQEILDRIAAAHQGQVVLNLAALERVQQDDDGWSSVVAALTETENAVEEARSSTLRFAGTAVGDPSRPAGVRIDELERATQSIRHVIEDTKPFRSSAAEHLAEAIDRYQRVQDVSKGLDRLRADINDLDQSVLPGLAGPNIDDNWIADVTARAEWALKVRELTDSVHGEHAFQALASLATRPGLQEAGEAWERSRDQLLTHFDETVQGALRETLKEEHSAHAQLHVWRGAVDQSESWLAARNVLQAVEEIGLNPVVESLMGQGASPADVVGSLRSAVLAGWASEVQRSDPRLRSDPLVTRDELVAQFRELDRQTVENAAAKVLAAAISRRPTVASSQTVLISAEAEKKRRHIPVRDLISRASDVIQALHPCFMMSPLAISQYLPPDIEFDVVIFDEASQIPPGDAINCIYRAKALIAAGDQRQLPPTAFFAAGQIDEDDLDDEDDLANDYESLLDLMKSSGGFSSIPLRWHYRSRHEHLIAYSNNSFYADKLTTFPGALSETPDSGVKFFKVDGVYRRSQGQNNPIEATTVAERVIHHLDHRPGRSIGVVAMSAPQRDAISDALTMLRANRPDLEQHFVEDRAGGIFVKSLEEVQGDERDVIVLSIGYGPDSAGVVYRNFGPINKKGGERRLNVAITRAKELVEVVSSMRAGDIGEVSSAGARHLRRYLDYAERGAAALEMELGPSGLGTDSPFEDSVISAIRSWGYDVQPQVGVSGFRIDIGVRHPNAPGVFMLGVECDGAMYHSSRTARDRDRLRHEILVGLGWQLHHIWGLDWYRNRAQEEQRLRRRLEECEANPYTGRVAASSTVAPVEITYESTEPMVVDKAARPAWMVPYTAARLDRLPYRDWTQTENARGLVSFVQDVVAVESPIHIDTLKKRLREHSSIERVNKGAARTLHRAITMADVRVDGVFLWAPGGKVTEARENGGRSLDEVHDDELRVAVDLMRAAQVGARDDEIAVAVARAFGWSRTPQGMAERLSALAQDGS